MSRLRADLSVHKLTKITKILFAVVINHLLLSSNPLGLLFPCGNAPLTLRRNGCNYIVCPSVLI